MLWWHFSRRTFGLALLAALPAGHVLGAFTTSDEKRPSLSLRATPTVSFAPARVTVRADVTGGADDFEEFYCPTLEWEWGDGTESSASADCDPYAAGASEIRRRYTTQHVYRQEGRFRVVLRLKKGSRVTASANAVVQVRPGLPGPAR